MNKQNLNGWIYERDGATFQITGDNQAAETLVDAESLDGSVKASFYREDVRRQGQLPQTAKAA